MSARGEFNAQDSDGRNSCPDCGLKQTHPFPNCGCPTDFTMRVEVMPGHFVQRDRPYRFTRHINQWHHTCPPRKEPDDER